MLSWSETDFSSLGSGLSRLGPSHWLQPLSLSLEDSLNTSESFLVLLFPKFGFPASMRFFRCISVCESIDTRYEAGPINIESLARTFQIYMRSIRGH